MLAMDQDQEVNFKQQPSPSGRQSREHHQINVTTDGMAPFAKFIGQSLVFSLQCTVLEILKPLVHQIQRFVDQLGGLISSHGTEHEVAQLYATCEGNVVTRATRVSRR